MNILLFIAVTMFTQLACSSAKRAEQLVAESECHTTIEGMLFSEGTWSDLFPALVVNSGGKERTYYGKLVGMEKDGIRFDPDRLGPVLDPPEKLYPFEEILCAVNEQHQVIYGSPPSALNMDLQLTSETTGKRVTITLLSKKPFAYCVEPGRYRVTAIEFWNHSKYRDKAVDPPTITLSVHAGRANYIGDLYLDYKPAEGDSVCILPFKGISRSKKGRDYFYRGWELIHVNSNYKNASGVHSLFVKKRPHFLTRGTREKVEALIRY